MDIILLAISSIIGVICGITSLASSQDRSAPKSVPLIFLGIFLFMMGILTWTIAAINTYVENNSNWVITNHEIKVMYNSPFYFDRDMKPHGLDGDAKFIDPTKTVMQIKTLTGGWKRGIYITETYKSNLISINDIKVEK